MFSAIEKKIVLYTSLFIAVVFNSSRLLALRRGAFIAQYWHFNGYELFCQALLNFIACVAAAYIDITFVRFGKKAFQGIVVMVFINMVILLAGIAIGVFIQLRLFGDDTPRTVFRGAYSMRLLASQALMGIVIKIILLLRENKEKDKENEKLRSAYLKAQLELLKEELNPHFFFNTLSSLSSVVREDPAKAQHYISHLSKMYRCSLNRHEKNLVTLRDELVMLDSYTALQKMRLEDGFEVSITMARQYYDFKLPYMSLQPLLENAVKHNMALTGSPLYIEVFVEDNMLVIQNNLQPQNFAAEGAGVGLANLNERYRILMHKEIVILKKADKFIVKLPLLQA